MLHTFCREAHKCRSISPCRSNSFQLHAYPHEFGPCHLRRDPIVLLSCSPIDIESSHVVDNNNNGEKNASTAQSQLHSMRLKIKESEFQRIEIYIYNTYFCSI